MTAHKDFLLELGCEELPPHSIEPASRALADAIAGQLTAAKLEFSTIERFATPRRIAVLVRALTTIQPEQKIVRRGPPTKIAFDADGAPTQAALKFAEQVGSIVEKLDREENKKGSWLSYSGSKPGQPALELLPTLIAKALENFFAAKMMRWQEKDVEFMRPVRWVVALLAEQVVPLNLFGCEAGRKSYAHRNHVEPVFNIDVAGNYEVLMQAHDVVASFATRKKQIEQAISQYCDENQVTQVASDRLINEITALVEWPVLLEGQFEAQFLQLPEEVIIEAVQSHQRYIPLRSASAVLSNTFLFVANLKSSDPAQVIRGNERVVRPRLSDAYFFWELDRKTSLDDWGQRLSGVTYHKKLGSLAEKIQRQRKIGAWLSKALAMDSDAIDRAIVLSKNDLATSMVGEFPGLQGVMGRYYAALDGEDEAIAQAIEEHYLPRFSGDKLPSTPISSAVALADKCDTLAGLFACNQQPTGTKDPYALRRQALAIVRMFIELPLEIAIEPLLEASLQVQPIPAKQDTKADLLEFLYGRMEAYYRSGDSALGALPGHFFVAAKAASPESLLDLHRRVEALQDFAKLDAAQSLSAANKRISKILQQADSDVNPGWSNDLLVDAAEKTLAKKVEALQAEIPELVTAKKYNEALTKLASLQLPVDKFFEDVMVMVEDKSLRENRLGLLKQLFNLFFSIADISKLPSTST